MKKAQAHLLISSLSGLFFIFLDQALKYLARANYADSYYLWRPWLGWEYFPNYGIAFSLPFPYPILIVATPLILLWFFLQIKKQKTTSLFNTGLIFVIAGAASNLIDRVLFNFTVDYFRVFTAIFNLADIAIVFGALTCFLADRRAGKKAK